MASAKTFLQPDSGWQWQVPDGAWTYDLYRSLPEDGRYEVINGRLVMSPSPNRKHQAVSRNLEFILLSWARTHQTGEVYDAPFDVVLSSPPEEQQYLQPDILFVSRERLHILTDDNVQGAPDLVVEVLSPGNAQQDWKDKKIAYERLVSPTTGCLIRTGISFRPTVWKRPIARWAGMRRTMCLNLRDSLASPSRWRKSGNSRTGT